MHTEPSTSNINETKSILLVGNNCINNQFIQREIEKKCHLYFNRAGTRDIEECRNSKIADIVLISYHELVNHPKIHLILSKILSDKWIVYDVPKDIGDKAITEIQLCNFIQLKGIIYQDAPIEHIERCLDTVCNDDFWLPRKVMAKMLSDVSPYEIKLQNTHINLTKREIQIFKKLIKGASNLEISEDLFISECTVKTHIYHIYKKIKVTNRKEAIRKAAYISEIDNTSSRRQ